MGCKDRTGGRERPGPGGEKVKTRAIVLFLFMVLLKCPGFVYGDIPAKERAALIALYKITNGDNWENNSGWKDGTLESDGFGPAGSEGTWHGITVSGDHVTTINLSNNNLDGPIPAELENLSNLEGLYLSSNRLTGGIPPQLGNLSNLQVLDVSSNQLAGSIPPELGGLQKLTILDFHSNSLTGRIHPQLGNLPNLQGLYLHLNNLTGDIPPELDRLSNLQFLYLHENKLSGTIPPQLGNLSNLKNLFLSGNRLDGPVPLQLGNLSNLKGDDSDFRYNKLYTHDDSLRSFLNSKQFGGIWENTQTVAPGGVTVRAISPTSTEVSWIPIAYSDDEGGYRVFYTQSPGGPYTLFGSTGTKIDYLLKVTGLESSSDYYFVVQTRTEAHKFNSSRLDSKYSNEVSSATPGSDKIISGRVATETGEGVEGVRLTFPPTSEFEITGANGNYSHTVKSGWTGKVKPSSPGYNFEPGEISFENVTSHLSGNNFIATPILQEISGKVTSADEGVEGVTLVFRADGGGPIEETKTDTDGSYSHDVSHGWTGTVAPSKGSIRFWPGHINYPPPGVTGSLTNEDYQLIVSLSLEVSREQDRLVTIKKEYGEIELNVGVLEGEDIPQLTIEKFVITRIDPDGGEMEITEYPVSEQKSQYQFGPYQDKYLEKGKTYTYIAKALDAAGNIIGESARKPI